MNPPERLNHPNAETGASASTHEQECASFQSSMAARIAAGEDLQSDAHLMSCLRCQTLLTELEAIAQAARMLLPTEEEPDDKLWQKIEQAISSDRR